MRDLPDGTPSNTIRDTIRAHLAETGESMRALSLRAGLNPKAVSDILSGASGRPTAGTLAALAAALGAPLPGSAPEETYAVLLARLEGEACALAASGMPATAPRRRLSRLRWLLRQTSWVASVQRVDRRAVLRFFARTEPAAVGLSKKSYATYKSDILAALDSATRTRPTSMRDVTGLYRDVYDRLLETPDDEIPADMKRAAGAFLVHLDAHGIAPPDITVTTLLDYHLHRVSTGARDETSVRKHLGRLVTLLDKLSVHPAFAAEAFAAPGTPFADGRDCYPVPPGALDDLMTAFDALRQWTQGEVSNTGQSRAEFIAALDAAGPAPAEGKKAALAAYRARKAQMGTAPRTDTVARNDALRASGFLLPSARWSDATWRTRRAFVFAGAKALLSRTGYAIETLEELCDPDVVATIAAILTEENDREDGVTSAYVATGLKALRKIARDYLCRDDAQLAELGALLSAYETDRRSIAPRNVARLRRFKGARLDAFCDLSATLMTQINRRITARRKAGLRAEDLYTAELARDVMAVLAHDILLARAPRSANLLRARLDWVRWTDDRATLVVPKQALKAPAGQTASRDLAIPLGVAQSRLLRAYLDRIRPKALQPGDAENPYLFPGQGKRSGQPYLGLLRRLCRIVHRVVGAEINPHLYRHLLGWIWLRDDPDKLPAVQQLLGHRSVQTTLAFYVELDEELALTKWQEHLTKRQ